MSIRFSFAWLVAGIACFAAIGCDRAGPASSTNRTEPVDPRLAQSRELFRQGDLAAATTTVHQILVADPSQPDALILLARIHAAQDEHGQAVETLTQAALRGTKHEFELRSEAVQMLVDRDLLWQASEQLQRLSELRPQHVRTRRQAAEVFNQLGLRHDANEQLRELIKLAPLTPAQLRSLLAPTGSFVAFAEIPDLKAAEVLQSPTVLNLVRGLASMNRLGSALALLQQTPAMKKRHPAAIALHGQLLLHAQQFDELSVWFAEAGGAAQRYPEYWIAVGGLATHQRRPDLATRAFGEAIRREPMDQAAIGGMTQSLEASGEIEAAERFRQRGQVIKELQEMTADIVRNPTIASAAFDAVADELVKLGQIAQAYQWQILGEQRIGLLGGEIRDDPQRRHRALASLDPRVADAKMICGLSLTDHPSDFDCLLAPASPRTSGRASPTPKPPRFVNVAERLDLNFVYQNASPPVNHHFLLHQALGSGIACLDYDLDGNVDLYAGQGAGNPPDDSGTLPNLLARNLTNRFQVVTDAAGCDDRGYTMGLTAGDWNQDGFPDLVIGNMGRNRLLINQGDGTFRRVAWNALWDEPQPSADPDFAAPMYTNALAIADVTGDHIPDIVEVNYTDDARIFEPIELFPDGSPVRLPGPLQFKAAVDRLFVGSGDGTMVGSVFHANGLPMRRYGMGLLIADIDGDRRNEIFVANDQSANNLWDAPQNRSPRNAQSSVAEFEDTAALRGVAYGQTGLPMASMGIAAADFDRSGTLDLHVTNFLDEWSNQYMQSSDGIFTDLAFPFGIAELSNGRLGFAAQALDYDNNTTVDLVIGNGHIEDFRRSGRRFQMPTDVLAGIGSSFQLQSVSGDPSYWSEGHLSRSLVILDWNRDGRMDFAVGDLQQPMALLQNDCESGHHWLQLQLVGTHSERDAIGAVVSVWIGEQRLMGYVQTGDGYMSRNEAVLHFGLEQSASVDQIEVQWPSGLTDQWRRVAGDRRWLIVEGEPQPFELR